MGGRLLQSHYLETGRKLIFSGWRASGIIAIRLGIAKLPSLDPFQDIDPMAEENEVINSNLTAVCNLTEEDRYIGHTKESDPSSDDDAVEWEKEGENELR